MAKLKKNVVCKRTGCLNRFDQRRTWHVYCCTKCQVAAGYEVEEKVRKPYRKKKFGKCRCGCGRPVSKDNHWLSEHCYRGGDCPSEDYHKAHV